MSKSCYLYFYKFDFITKIGKRKHIAIRTLDKRLKANNGVAVYTRRKKAEEYSENALTKKEIKRRAGMHSAKLAIDIRRRRILTVVSRIKAVLRKKLGFEDLLDQEKKEAL